MDFESYYENTRVAEFIHRHGFTRVALQFPDELLKDSTRVVKSLYEKLNSLNVQNVKLYMMADTTYGSCCVDEVGASHVNADCIIHYGHTCLSQTSTLPALFIFGKASISVSNCVTNLHNCGQRIGKPILVLYGLEYAHAIQDIKEALISDMPRFCVSTSGLEPLYADVRCSVVCPLQASESANRLEFVNCEDSNGFVEGTNMAYGIGGLTWSLPEGHKMDDYLIFWIGLDNSAFANVVLQFNSCEIDCLITDVSQQKKILNRRYYLVEKAKDANIIGILVGTLGVAGYLNMIHRMKEMITQAGKKAYTFVMGRPNPAKLANFPECDVFVFVSCAQTALFDSKEFLAPVITPFEAMVALSRGSQWTGEYVMEFSDLIASSKFEVRKQSEEARFSFLKGGYVENLEPEDDDAVEKDEILALVDVTEKALLVRDNNSLSIKKADAKSGAEYFATRSYHGLEINGDNRSPETFLIGRSGKASGYEDEKIEQQTL
ncbi:diphthamide biosynthesis 2 [Olea europaea subsp. europaea]|uniref:2-(3-amino-3-carboxypropyl)histidine synthase subunit 2 n=1 Tax=Olea europaea subsp. europaea TaxID=158383 RepID=A0A8S0V7V9_OLEEU|nr:diphthamide biosynthesis 2 [Olea europaea subsp. europaea]